MFPGNYQTTSRFENSGIFGRMESAQGALICTRETENILPIRPTEGLGLSLHFVPNMQSADYIILH